MGGGGRRAAAEEEAAARPEVGWARLRRGAEGHRAPAVARAHQEAIRLLPAAAPARVPLLRAARRRRARYGALCERRGRHAAGRAALLRIGRGARLWLPRQGGGGRPGHPQEGHPAEQGGGRAGGPRGGRHGHRVARGAARVRRAHGHTRRGGGGRCRLHLRGPHARPRAHRPRRRGGRAAREAALRPRRRGHRGPGGHE
mmetsp:Transcript_47376/g.113688  ORF Transcript_47376/g.113688 Transcript_47376/m.113688 type:complete len:200 (-) Transcript_47376:414-1013(-)